MRSLVTVVAIAVVATALALSVSATSLAAPESGVDIVVTTGGVAVTIATPGCLNYDGGVRSFDLIVRAGAWVSNGFDPSAGWITLVSNGLGDYRFSSWRGLHVCGGTSVSEALAELRKIDEGGYNNPRVVVNPISVSTATPTATQTHTPNPTATATRTSSPTVTQTPVATGTPTATATTVPGATSTPTVTPVASNSTHIIVTRNGIAESIDSPGCLNYDGTNRDFRVVSFNGTWVSNGFSQPLGMPGYWLNKYGQEHAVYSLFAWSGYHVCAGRDLSEALAELGKVDPNALNNPLYAYPFERLLGRLFLPLTLK